MGWTGECIIVQREKTGFNVNTRLRAVLSFRDVARPTDLNEFLWANLRVRSGTSCMVDIITSSDLTVFSGLDLDHYD
jgi:hypothetical protein